MPHHGPVPFADFDADGDGFISEQEFNETRAAHMAAMAAEGREMKGAASHPSFADLDTDGDGLLSEDELTAGQKAHMKTMRGENKGGCKGKGKGKHHDKMKHKKMKHEHGKEMEMPTFEDIDTDGDGSISPEEFAAHQASHHGKQD